MQFSNPISTPYAPNNSYNSTAYLPSITLNQFAPKNKISDTHCHAANNAHQLVRRPIFGNLYDQNRELGLKVAGDDSLKYGKGHRDAKRKNIFDKSHSTKQVFSHSRGVIQENRREQQGNWAVTKSNETKRRNNRKRNNIFRSYHPKIKISSSKEQLSLKNSENMLNINFDQMAHQKRVSNYQQLSSKRMARREDQQIPLNTINTANNANKLPLRDTYVAERDWEYISQIKQPKELSDLMKKQLLDVPCHRIERSFTKGVLSKDITSKSKQFGVCNVQLQEESIIGYSHREVLIRDMQDLPQLLLQANENRFIVKTNQLNKPKFQSANLIECKQQLPNTVKIQPSSKETNKSSQPTRNTSNLGTKMNSHQTLPYILVLLGALLLVIQLSK